MLEQQKVTVTGHLRLKRGIYQLVTIAKFPDGTKKEKSKSTGLQEKGNKKRAERMLADLIREMEEHQNIKHAIYMLNAKERYNWFLREYKDLIDRVSHRHVASFLNMTPVTLSRLRKEFREQEE